MPDICAKSPYLGNAADWPWVWAIRDNAQLDWKRGLPRDEVLRVSALQNQMPVKIGPGLFLSDARSVKNVERLSKLGITHVLNVAGKEASGPKDAYQRANITSHDLSGRDQPGYAMLENHLAEAMAFIRNARIKGGKAVVHCNMGMNRCGAIVAAVLVLGYDAPSEDGRSKTAFEGGSAGDDVGAVRQNSSGINGVELSVVETARRDSSTANLLAMDEEMGGGAVSTGGMSVLETVRLCRRARGNCLLFNETFQEELVAFARAHGALGPKPGDQGSVVATPAPPPFNSPSQFACIAPSSSTIGFYVVSLLLSAFAFFVMINLVK